MCNPPWPSEETGQGLETLAAQGRGNL
jgi:hypothetical protein